jgi:hypothetical protein
MGLLRLLPLLLLVACGGDEPSTLASPAPPPPPDRDTWWNGATRLPEGAERILAPRELRHLLAEGRRLGFDRDEAWWQRRGAWAAERILDLDPDDIEANELAGRRRLQSIEGFAEVWKRMIETRAPTPEIGELLDRYGPWVEEGRPVFLNAEEYSIERARLAEAARYLDRVEGNPAYAAEQRWLLRVKTSAHADYAYVHTRCGPFLVFYSARDLQRDPEADPRGEDERLAVRRDLHLRRLGQWSGIYEELLNDLRELFPDAWAAYGLEPDTLFPQWIFADRAWYEEFAGRIRRDQEEPPYRVGFLHAPSGWAYLAEPPDAAAMDAFKETAAYLAALQLLRHWARDPSDPTISHWDRSEAYWFKEGLPAFLASRRVAEPVEGQLLKGVQELPPLLSVVERRSRLDPRGRALLEGALPAEMGATDLAWALVRHLSSDELRKDFERFLRSQIEGTRKGVTWFEECFSVEGPEGWRALERAAYAGLR